MTTKRKFTFVYRMSVSFAHTIEAENIDEAHAIAVEPLFEPKSSATFYETASNALRLAEPGDERLELSELVEDDETGETFDVGPCDNGL